MEAFVYLKHFMVRNEKSDILSTCITIEVGNLSEFP